MNANGKIPEYTEEDIDAYAKSGPFPEAFNREFIRRLELAGRLKIVDKTADRPGQ